MKKMLKCFSSVIIVGLLFTGCVSKAPEAPSASPEAPVTASAPASEQPSESASASSSESPDTSADLATDEFMKIDKDKKEISLQAEVNGKYFTEPTRHGLVYKDGGNGEKAVLRGLEDEKKFYEALMSLGFTAGNNVTMEDMKKSVKVEGEKLDVFVTWDGLGKEIPFKDIIKSSEDRPMDIRFGGNIDRAKDKNTGCELCLDSCAVGITSNAAYETGASSKIQFYGNQDVLPKDGTRVTVIFRKAQ